MVLSIGTKKKMDILAINPISIIATFPSLFLSFLVVIVFFMRKLGEKRKGKKRYHPVVDSTTKQLINFHRIHDYMADLAAKYKTYRLESPFRREIYTSDPANIEYILKTNFDNYGKVTYPHTHIYILKKNTTFSVSFLFGPSQK